MEQITVTFDVHADMNMSELTALADAYLTKLRLNPITLHGALITPQNIGMGIPTTK